MPTVTQTTTPESRERMEAVLNVLRSRGALKDSQCPSCSTDNWNVDFVAIAAFSLPMQGFPPPPNVVLHFGASSKSGYIPALTIACTNCGYTKIHNLNLLGLGA